MDYIQSKKQEDQCPFCYEMRGEDGPQNLIVYRGRFNVVILNRYPYTSGHLMVVPYEHKPTIEGLDAGTRAEMMELSNRCLKALAEAYRPEGFNIGINIGEAAGAGIVEHVHIHVVPRWSGDTNFMSSLSETRIVPESLEESYIRIREAWESEPTQNNEK